MTTANFRKRRFTNRVYSILFILCLAATMFGTLPVNAQKKEGKSSTEAGKNSSAGTCSNPTLLWDNGTFTGFFGASLPAYESEPFSARTADDFVVPPGTGVVLSRISADMQTGMPAIINPSELAFVEIYATDASGNGPTRGRVPPLYSFPATGGTVLGFGSGYSVVRFTFEIPGIPLSPGRYWVSPVYRGPLGMGAFCASNGNPTDSGQLSYTKTERPFFMEWVDMNTRGTPEQPHHAFSVWVCPQVAPQPVNEQISFTTTTQGLTGITGTCATQGYTNQYNLNVDLRNIGPNMLNSPYFQVLELQEGGTVKPVNPYRLRTADDFNATECTGGLVGTTQAIPGPIAPNQVVPVNFQIAMPRLARFRFFVGVFASVGEGWPGRSAARRLGKLSVEATGFDKAGNPVLTATFIPEKGMPTLNVAGARGTVAK